MRRPRARHVVNVNREANVELTVVAVARGEAWVELVHDEVTIQTTITSDNVPGARRVNLSVQRVSGIACRHQDPFRARATRLLGAWRRGDDPVVRLARMPS